MIFLKRGKGNTVYRYLLNVYVMYRPLCVGVKGSNPAKHHAKKLGGEMVQDGIPGTLGLMISEQFLFV